MNSGNHLPLIDVLLSQVLKLYKLQTLHSISMILYIGKPKLFIIQACQGDRLDPGVTLARTETDGHPSHTYRIPIHADFLIAYSTIPGL